MQSTNFMRCLAPVPVPVPSCIHPGHNAVVHGATVGDTCIIGIGSRVLDGCVIGEGSMVAAGAVVTPRTIAPPGSLIVGVPAKVKQLTGAKKDSLKMMCQLNAQAYVNLIPQ